MGIIEIKNLYKSFGATKVFSGLNLSIQKGEVVVIIGSSGCGKSMLLRSIEMLEKPDAGQIIIDGQEITAKDADIGKIRRSMGMVFQDFGLFSNMSVLENLCIAPIKLLGMAKDEAEKKAMELLTSAGLADKADEPIRILSGGQKQRIAICRCMMMDPPIILFDEPTSALDPLMVGKLLATLRLLARRGLTMVIVTHEMAFAKQIANRVVFLADGVVYEDGTPEEIFEHPKKEKTITFVRKLRHLFCRIDTKKYDLAAIRNSIIDFAGKFDIDEEKSALLQFFAQNKADLKMSPKGSKLLKSAQNQSLKNQIVELFRPSAKNGDGGTADALRYEYEDLSAGIKESSDQKNVVVFNTPIGEEEDSHLGDFIPDDDALAPADAASMLLLKEQLAEVLKTLTPREEKVLSLRFGLEDGHPRTLEEVGKEFNVTRERIRQIEAKALRKLRHPSRSKKLKDFLD